MEETNNNFDWSKFILPGAIIVAGILISAAVIYSNSRFSDGTASVGNISKGQNADEFNSCLDSSKYVEEVNNDLKDGQAAGVSGTPGFFINGKLVVGAQPFGVFQSVIEEKLQEEREEREELTNLIDDDAHLGDENAPVVMIEFSDFQCPFCRSFWRDTLPLIKSEYIDTGKVRFVYRDFPLGFHQGAMPAAQAAECAREQDKFWEMHDKIFIEQEKQGTGTIQFGADDLKRWASEIGLK